MDRRAFFLAGPVGALLAVVGLRLKPKASMALEWAALQESLRDVWPMESNLTPYSTLLFLDAQRSAAKLALVRK